MRSLTRKHSPRPGSALARSLRMFANEVLTFLDAVTSPGRVIAEVQEMHALRLEANRIAAEDPARAAVLRDRAARIGLD